ncbi:S-adenosyl-L-methionine-dependent methyltransferase, partial [Ramicandelaber brevisporus]
MPYIEAQVLQTERLCQMYLQLKPTDRLLHVGMGWGTIPVYAGMNYNALVCGISNSPNQVERARSLIDDAGMRSRVKALLMDFRELPSLRLPTINRQPAHHITFTKILALDYPDQVGIKNLPLFLHIMSEMLVPGGLLLLQFTVTPFGAPTVAQRWWTRCFAGARIPSLASVSGSEYGASLEAYIAMLGVAGFEVVAADNISRDAATTLASWNDSLADNASSETDPVEAEYRVWELWTAWMSSAIERGVIAKYMVSARKR